MNNTKICLRGIGWGGIDLIDVAQCRNQWRTLLNTAKNLGVPENVREFLNS
jgi:hypothetical protein